MSAGIIKSTETVVFMICAIDVGIVKPVGIASAITKNIGERNAKSLID
jgi:hypothetical protein